MAIKIIFAAIIFVGVSFLSRVLVAWLKETALANRKRSPESVIAKSYSHRKTQARKLSRLKLADRNEIRLITTS